MVGSCPAGLWVCCAAAVLLMAALASPVQAVDSSAAKRLFADPPAEYSSAPFWVWNDAMTDENVKTTLQDLAGQKIREVFVHPRPGLVTPYLDEEWFRLFGVALAEAERLGMDLWIYDENSYPSGFAGGHVPEVMPESRGRGLAVREQTGPPPRSEEFAFVFRRVGDAWEDAGQAVRAGTAPPQATYLIFSVQRAGNSPWYGNRCYVDLLYPGVTERFLAVTLEPYRRSFGAHFGKRIPGVFTDEPLVLPAGGLPWTDDLAEQFEKRWDYRLTDHLPSLIRPTGDWQRIRHNYFQVVLELFIARWAKPYHDYCAKYDLQFTGHYWEHEWPSCLVVPDNMALSAWQQRPGIDTLMNEYSDDVRAQFGNIRAAKEISSVANQLGLPRTLCEAYGASSWNLRFADMKRIGDWLQVFGVNTINQHLSYVSIRGMRKRDHPPSFSYHAPWWDCYQAQATYLARLTTAMTQGREENPVLVLEPTTTAWMYQAGGDDERRLNDLGQSFQRLVMQLAKAQVEFDLGCENVLARAGSVDGKSLVVGRRKYTTVVLPPLMENLNRPTATLLEEYVRAGGTALCCGEPPRRVDGVVSNWAENAPQERNWQRVSAADVPALLSAAPVDGFAVEPARGREGLLFHHRRRLEDGYILLLVNSSGDAPAAGLVKAPAGGIEQWDLDTGRVRPYPFAAGVDGSVEARYDLPPGGSLLLFLVDRRMEPFEDPVDTTTIIAADGPPAVRRIEPNVLVLDYVDVTVGGETRTGTYVLKAADFIFRASSAAGNPWDGAVQFKDEIVRRTYPANSGFEAVYRFEIRDQVPADLSFVVERADLYTITCNGRPVAAGKDAWWLDRSFSKIDITAAAEVGSNEVAIRAAPLTVFHELEAAYVIGDFALQAAESGFAIVPPVPLDLGPWNTQSCPLYSAGVSYTQQFTVPAVNGSFKLALPGWFGSVAKVVVNGRPAGCIGSPPWECDVTGQIRVGVNTVEVVVVGTLKNTLGPHHGNPPAGRLWPPMFNNAPENGPPPGNGYETCGYGLWEPFELRQTVPE